MNGYKGTAESLRRLENILKKIDEVQKSVQAIMKDDPEAIEVLSSDIAHYIQYLKGVGEYSEYRSDKGVRINNLHSTLKELKIFEYGIGISISRLKKPGIGFNTKNGERQYYEARRDRKNFRVITALKERWEKKGLKVVFSETSDFFQFLAVLIYGNTDQTGAARKAYQRCFEKRDKKYVLDRFRNREKRQNP